MKKLIESLRMSLIILATFAVAFVSCGGKEEALNPGGGNNNPPGGGGAATPTFNTLTANPTAGWFDTSVVLNWTGSNFSSATVVGNNGATAVVNGNSALTSNLATTTRFTVTLINGADGSKTATQYIDVPVWTQRMTNLCKKKGWYMTTNTSIACNAFGVPLPGALPVSETIWTDTLSFNPDGTGKKKTQGGQTSDISWAFQAQETKYGESINDPSPYDIQELTVLIWKRTRVTQDLAVPGTYSLKTYIYKSSPK